MELRKHVKQPSRYEPELADAAHEVRYMPRTKKPLFRPPFVDFNPHLPPAAFPSLDKPRLALSETRHVRDCDGSETYQILPSYTSRQSLHSSEPLLPSVESMSLISSRNPMISAGVQNRGVDTLNEGHNSPTHTYSQTQDGFQRELPAQGIMHEMETSDEDTAPSNQRPSYQRSSSKKRSFPTWDELYPVHRLEILDGMAARGFSIEDTYNLLGISYEQYDEMVKWDNQRNKVADREDTKLLSMQQDVHQRLLNTGEFRTGSITQATYKHLFNHHLGSIVNSDKQNFTICTKSHLSKAQAFLRAKGLTATLAGVWEEPIVGNLQQGVKAPPLENNTGGGVMQAPARNRRFEHSANSSPSRRAAEERGRSPVKRKHLNNSEETLSTQARLLPTDQGQQTMPPNGAHAPAEQEAVHQIRFVDSLPNADGDKVLQNVSRNFVQDTSLHPPTRQSGTHGSTPHSSTALDHKTSASANEEDDMTSTITVEPKRKYLGTAKPNTSTQSHPSATDNSQTEYIGLQGVWKTSNETEALSRNTFDALERLRLESLKHSARPGPKVGTYVGVERHINIPNVQGQTNRKNFKQLAVATPSFGVKPMGDRQKIGTSSAGTILATTPATLGKMGQSSSITPTRTGSGSGSSTRSQIATRIPARYREDLIEIGSPTSSKAGMKSATKIGVQAKPRSGRGGWRGGPKKHVLEGGAAQEAPDPKKKQVRMQKSPVLTLNEPSEEIKPTPHPEGAVSIGSDKEKNGVMAGGIVPQKKPSVTLNVKKRVSKRGLVDDELDL